jgi:hypothetical protein
MMFRPRHPAPLTGKERIETRLPLIGGRLERIAQTFSDRHDLRIVFQPKTCKTDMLGTIVLPTNVAELSDDDMDLVWAKVNHEAEHVRVQVECEQKAADKANVAVNKAIYARCEAIVTPEVRRLVIGKRTRCSKANTPVGLLNDANSPVIALMFNVVEDVRIERMASARFKGVAQHLKAGRDHAHAAWTAKLTANPLGAEPVYQVGIGIIFMAWDLNYDFLHQSALDALTALSPFHTHLDPSHLVSVWDAWNLGLCYADALLAAGASIDPEELDAMVRKRSPSEGVSPIIDGTEVSPIIDGTEGVSPIIDGPQDEDIATDEGTETPLEGGGGWTEAKRGPTESPKMTAVGALEALKALSREVPNLKTVESPIHEATDEAIVKQAGVAPTNTARADGATDYSVSPEASKRDSISTPKITPAVVAAARTLSEGVSAEAATLASRLRQLLAIRSQSINAYACRTGRLDRRAMWRCNVRSPGSAVPDNVRIRANPGEVHDVAIGLLGDCSGSMAGSKFRLMQQGILLLGDCLDTINRSTPNSIQMAAWGFTASGDVTRSHPGPRDQPGSWGRRAAIEHYNWCDWDESWDRVRPRVAANVRLYENADPCSVKWALQQVRSRKSKRHILMVLSDGQPAAPGNWKKMRRELKASIQAAISAGIEVWGFGMMDNSVEHYYPNHRVCNNLGQMSKMILEVAPYWFNLHNMASSS